MRLPLTCLLHSVLGISAAFSAEITGAASKSGRLKPESRDAQPFVAAPDGSEETNRRSLRLPPGFVAETWASEPMISNPVAFTFDDQGRCFTSETNRYRSSTLDIRHYMFMLEDDLASRNVEDRIRYSKKNFPTDWQTLELQTEVVRLLEDTSGGGRADRSRVYADGFNTILDGIASGVLAYNGNVWFTNIPNLWLFKGIKPDGRAESKASLSFGWGVRYSYTGHDFHGLSLGPDGRLYFTIGDRGAHITDPKTGKTLIDLPDEGGVFRCEQDGSHLELVMRGLRNPQETAFDHLGNLFTGDNDGDMGDRERFVYVVMGGDSGWRVGWQHHPIGKAYNPWMSENLWRPRDATNSQPAYLISPILNIPDGPSGVAHYPGTGLPQQYDDHFFVCSFKGNSASSAINHWSVKPFGAGFVTDQEPKEFIGISKPTDVEFGPDSQLYYSDWGAEGWESKGRGRIYKIRHEEAYAAAKPQVEKVQSLLKSGLTSLPTAELAELLSFPDQRIRLRAQWSLAARPEAADTFLRVLSTTKDRLPRLHAIWGIGQVDRSKRMLKDSPPNNALAKLLPFLTDPDSEVRANVLKVIGDNQATAVASDNALTTCLKDPEPRVRFFAALAVAQTKATSVLPQVIEMVRENADQDQYLRHAGVFALTSCADHAVLKKASADSSPAVRLAALLAYGRLKHPDISKFLADGSPELVTEAARVITDAPVNAAFPALAKLLSREGLNVHVALRALNAAFRTGSAENAKDVVAYASNPRNEQGLRVEALTQIGFWSRPPARDRVIGIYRPLPERPAKDAQTALADAFSALIGGDAKVALLACEAVSKIQAAGCSQLLLEAVKNESLTGQVRTAALDTLASLQTADLQEALSTALTSTDSALRTMAALLLAKTDSAAAAKRLVEAWSGATSSAKKQLADTLAKITGPTADDFFANTVSNLSKEPPDTHLEILEGAASRSSPVVKKALEKYQASLPADDLLAKFAPTLFGGNRQAGETLFKEHAVAACMRCHKIKGSGGDAGPELTRFAKTHDRNYILESIVNVNAKIAPGYQMVAITLKDGSFKGGLLKSEDAANVTLQMPPSPPEVIPVSQIVKRDNAPSGMIPNIPDFISRRELRDIVEYVSSLK